MRRFVVLAACLLSAWACRGRESSRPQRPPSLTANALSHSDTVPGNAWSVDHLEAHLIFEDGSSSSYDVMDTPTNHPPLWNTIIGEGIAMDKSGRHHASTSTLVVAGVSGPPRGYAPGLTALLQVSGPGRAAQTYSDTVPRLDSLGRTRIAFRVPDTGCDTLRLSARLSVDTAVVRTGLVLFECGE